MIMDRLYGGVCYAGIDTDPELKYPVMKLYVIEIDNNLMFYLVCRKELVELHSLTSRATSLPLVLVSCSYSMSTSRNGLVHSLPFQYSH